MSSNEFLSRQFLSDWPYRVCLPYDVDLLQLARWVSATSECKAPSRFDIVTGDGSHAWSGSDVIELFSEIQRKCINCSLSHSYVVCNEPKSVMFFDMHGRFGFFAADLRLLQKLYPFSREIMLENFMLLQEEDDDMRLAEVFQAVQSDQRKSENPDLRSEGN